MKVVESGYKIDLHIHSVYSRAKDKGKVAFNTIENISVLAEKLNANGVQMCAITDHDAFGFDMYKALKAYEQICRTDTQATGQVWRARGVALPRLHNPGVVLHHMGWF